MQIETGVLGSATMTVTSRDTASAVGSGDVAVLATPIVVAICEEAAVAAVARALVPTETSVGTHVAIDHLRPSPVGAVVTAEAILSRVDGSSLSFSVEVRDGDVVVARGTVERAIVDRKRFIDGLSRE